MTSAWMWQEGVRTAGVNLNDKRMRLEWQDEMAGPSCQLYPSFQSLDDFLANGAGYFANPPQDVVDEIRTAIVQLQTAEAED